MSERLDRLGLAALCLTAAYFAIGVLWMHARRDIGFPANDVYAYVYPTSVYAWRAIREGAGLLWNPYQDCGQPFFAISQTGLLYPVNVLFAILEREPALLVSVFLNLTIAGTGAFLLCRSLGVGVPAALCGALTFQLGGSTVQLAAWTPIHIATYAWLAVAMWRAERLVGGPTIRRSILLGLALTVQLLPGFPQIVFFTYQLIALRVGWSMLTGEARRPAAVIGGTAVGLALPLLLGAIQLLPSLEVARASLRSLPLSTSDIGPGFTWKDLAGNLRAYAPYPGNFLVIVMAMLALLASRRAMAIRHTLFYAAVASVYFIISLGPGTPFFDLYARLPLGNTFRGSARLLWVTNFAMAVLAGLGAEAVLSLGAMSSQRFRAATLAVPLGVLLFQLLVPTGLRWSDTLLALALLVTVVVCRQARGTVWARVPVFLLVSTMAANTVVFGPPPLYSPRLGDLYAAAAPAFSFVRARLTPQDRVLIMGRHGAYPDFALTQKAASLFRVPAIFDYEPQASRFYAEFFAFMRTGRSIGRLDDWYWIFDDLMPPTLQRRLFDLTAARYVIVDRALDKVPRVLASGARLLTEVGYVRIYENEQALPRARYVPRIAVVPADEVLPRLIAGEFDPLRVALVGEAPRSGFLGADAAAGSAEFMLDAAERVVIRVHASAPGFLFLADQYFPGWTVRVNGVQSEILRADHTFRLVEVPAGDSEVAFTYRPSSVRLGALLSLATLCVLVVVWVRATPTKTGT